MEDIDVPDVSPPGLFFAGSDDDEPPVSVKSPSLPPASSPRTSRSRSSPPLLFLENSDDDDSMYMSSKPSASSEKTKRPVSIEDEDPDIQIMNHSQLSTKNNFNQRSRHTSLSPTLDKETLPTGPVFKKRRLLSPEPESALTLATKFLPAYLGEVVIQNAWSNVSGKGYVKQNETVLVKREEQDVSQAGTSKPKPTTGKKKQISIATMLKPQPAKTSKSMKKKKTDNIVRLVNIKGFGDHCSNYLP